MTAALVAPIIDGWKVLADYAEPATAGGGYCEVQDDGEFTASYDARCAILSDAANHDEKTEPNNAIPEAPVRRDGRREPTSAETDG